VDNGSRGTVPQALARARLVPSPPRLTMQSTPRSHICAAARIVSSWLDSTSMCSSRTVAASLRLSWPFQQLVNASGTVRTVSTPVASSPSNTRRTMFTFSLLLNTEPCATRRLISLPEDGLAIMPTHATRYPFSQCHIAHLTSHIWPHDWYVGV